MIFLKNMTETELQFSKVRCYGIYEKIGRSDGIGDPLKPPPLQNEIVSLCENKFTSIQQNLAKY